jgi:polar amino acid transport system permease protein
VLIYMIGFGLPISGVPFFSDLSQYTLAALALTILYGAYVAEVYRAGIESIHWSQTAAARSLGLSQGKTMRFVVLPQAVRRVIPPLLNDFIGLQKDTALIGVIGVLDGFRRAQIYAGQNFNLSSFTVLAACYVVITIPMTRFTDRLLRRDQERLRVGGK